MALANGVDSAVLLATLYSEITTGGFSCINVPIVCVTGNRSLIDALKSTKSVTEKRLCLEISSMKELIHSGTNQQILWSATREQLANCLTKKRASALGLLKVFSTGVCYLKD